MQLEQLEQELNPKYTTLGGVILVIIGFVFLVIPERIGLIVILGFSTLFLGIILFSLGVVGLISNWYKNRKK